MGYDELTCNEKIPPGILRGAVHTYINAELRTIRNRWCASGAQGRVIGNDIDWPVWERMNHPYAEIGGMVIECMTTN